MNAEFDHGMLNLPLGHRGRGGSIERTIDAALEQIAQEKRAERLADKQRRSESQAAEKARVKLTREDCEGATLIRDQFGWHKVVRVNAKTVTVETPYSWTEAIAYVNILEVR